MLAIIDFGLGMPEAEVAAANRRLAGAESFTVAPSKYLGHYVAGNLAARHGIRVHLQHSPGTGITATVALPANLLTIDGQGRALAGPTDDQLASVARLTGARGDGGQPPGPTLGRPPGPTARSHRRDA